LLKIKKQPKISLAITYFAVEDKSIKAEGTIKILDQEKECVGTFAVVSHNNRYVCVLPEEENLEITRLHKKSILNYVREHAKKNTET